MGESGGRRALLLTHYTPIISFLLSLILTHLGHQPENYIKRDNLFRNILV
jgi:hypothetical protein